MIQFDDIVSVLGQIAGVEIIETSDDATAEDHSLPSVIVDYGPGTIAPFLESGEPYIKATYSLTISVSVEPNRKVARKAINDLTKEVLKCLIARYNGLQYGTAYPQTIPYGLGEALAYGIDITLPEEEFILDD